MKLQKILIVDDSEVTRKMHSIFLRPFGNISVLFADNGHAGLTMLLQHSDVDLIILDLEMPEMTGMEFLAARRRDPRLTHIPILVVSSLADTKTIKATQAAGAAAFVAKPFGPDDFFSAIRRAMRPGAAEVVA